jgi:hypothetical protein
MSWSSPSNSLQKRRSRARRGSAPVPRRWIGCSAIKWTDLGSGRLVIRVLRLEGRWVGAPGAPIADEIAVLSPARSGGSPCASKPIQAKADLVGDFRPRCVWEFALHARDDLLDYVIGQAVGPAGGHDFVERRGFGRHEETPLVAGGLPLGTVRVWDGTWSRYYLRIGRLGEMSHPVGLGTARRPTGHSRGSSGARQSNRRAGLERLAHGGRGNVSFLQAELRMLADAGRDLRGHVHGAASWSPGPWRAVGSVSPLPVDRDWPNIGAVHGPGLCQPTHFDERFPGEARLPIIPGGLRPKGLQSTLVHALLIMLVVRDSRTAPP